MPTGASQIFVEKTRQAALILGLGGGPITHASTTGQTADDHHDQVHDLAGADHNAATLATLNAKISDATLDDSGDSRAPDGTAGGDLNGSYPNPGVDDGADGSAIHDDVSGEIAAVTLKGTPLGADVVLIEDSADTDSKKRATAQSIADLAPLGAGEYVYAREELAPNTAGGTFTSGAFRTRNLDTLVINDIGAGVSLASDEITLPAGTWRCFITLPFFAVVGSAGRLFNVTDAAVVPDMISSTGFSAGTNPVFIQGQFVLAASKALRIEHKCEVTISTNGFGRADTLSGQNSVYTEAVFVRVAL